MILLRGCASRPTKLKTNTNSGRSVSGLRRLPTAGGDTIADSPLRAPPPAPLAHSANVAAHGSVGAALGCGATRTLVHSLLSDVCGTGSSRSTVSYPVRLSCIRQAGWTPQRACLDAGLGCSSGRTAGCGPRRRSTAGPDCQRRAARGAWRVVQTVNEEQHGVLGEWSRLSTKSSTGCLASSPDCQRRAARGAWRVVQTVNEEQHGVLGE